LRSTVSKEACRLVCLAAKVAQEKLDSFCDKLLNRDGLLKLINSGNKVNAENGHECIVTMLEYVKCPKVIPRIIDELGSKNTAVRQKIATYLKLIMDVYPENILDKNLALIETAITAAIADASKEVRQITRQTFLIFAERYPSRSPKLYAKFDTAVQKALQEEALSFQRNRSNEGREVRETRETREVREIAQKKPIKERDLSSNRDVIQSRDLKEIKESKETPKENKLPARPATGILKKGNSRPLTESQEIKKEFNNLDNRSTRASEATISFEKGVIPKRSASIYKTQSGRVASPPRKRDESASRLLSTSMHIQGNSSSEKKNPRYSQAVIKSQVLNNSHFLEEKESITRPSTSTSASSKVLF